MTTTFERLLTCRPVNRMAGLHTASRAEPIEVSAAEAEALRQKQEALHDHLMTSYRKKFLQPNGQPTFVLQDLMRRNEKLRRHGKPPEPLPHLDPIGYYETAKLRGAHQ